MQPYLALSASVPTEDVSIWVTDIQIHFLKRPYIDKKKKKVGDSNRSESYFQPQNMNVG